MRALALALMVAGIAHAAPPLAIGHVAVVDVARGTVDRDRHVVVADGRIAAIGDDTVVPQDARRIDGAGAWLVPGFVDMHVHLFNNASRRAPNDWALPLFVASGVTGVREMAARVEDATQVRRWNAAVDAGELVAPRVLAVGVPVRCGPADGLVAQLDAIGEAGAFAKVFSGVDAECWRELVAAARARGVVVAGHAPPAPALTAAARDGLRSAEHLMRAFEACATDGDVPPSAEDDEAAARARELRMLASFDRARCVAVGRALAAARQAHVPTLVLLRHERDVADPQSDPRWPLLRGDEQARWLRYLAPGYLQPAALAAARDRGALAVTAALHDAGVTMLAGTDAPMPNVWPGGSLHEELALLVEAGLTPAAALRAATLEPARFLGIDGEAGTVAVGQRADLVLLDANPLADIAATRRVRAVVLAGRLLDRAALETARTPRRTAAPR